MGQSSNNGGMSSEAYQVLVRKVAEKVWKMLRDQLSEEKERRTKRDRRSR